MILASTSDAHRQIDIRRGTGHAMPDNNLPFAEHVPSSWGESLLDQPARVVCGRSTYESGTKPKAPAGSP